MSRSLRVEFEDEMFDSFPPFPSDLKERVDWFDVAINKTNVVFNYSEFNPRTQESGSDTEREEPVTDYEKGIDRLAENMDGMIGKIVDYHVAPYAPETPKDEPNPLYDYVVLDIKGTKFNAGFDEVRVTKRKNKQQRRSVNMDVYYDLSEEKINFLEKAYLAAIPAEIAKYGDSTKSLIKCAINDFLGDVIHAKENPYHFGGTRVIEVDKDYKGCYKIFIDKDGTETIT